MANTAPQVRELNTAEVANVAVDCSGFLDSGETITGAVTVTEVTTSELTITGAQTNGSSIEVDGSTVTAGLGVQFTVNTTGSAAGTYKILITVVTSATQTRKGFVTLVVE